MIIYDKVEQGTDEWLKLRMGKFTASVFPKLFMKKDTQGYQDAINKVVFERLTGELPESFSNDWMNRGTELEPVAIDIYENTTFNKVKRIGFIEHSEWIGCSPDGIVGKDGMLQVKCPKYSTLISYILSDQIPKDYMIQMQGEMLVAEKQWSDFYVFHPKLKPILKRVERNSKMHIEIWDKLFEAIADVEKRIVKISS